MIFLAVAVGAYLIGLVGYYKLARRIMQDTDPVVADMFLAKVGTGLLALIWPAMLYYNLLQEAVKQ